MSTNSSAETEAPETTGGDGPLLDLTDAGVKKFIKQAKARGYVTMDELNKVLPSEEVSPDAIEDTLAMLSEMGVNVVEADLTVARLAENRFWVVTSVGSHIHDLAWLQRHIADTDHCTVSDLTPGLPMLGGATGTLVGTAAGFASGSSIAGAAAGHGEHLQPEPLRRVIGEIERRRIEEKGKALLNDQRTYNLNPQSGR
ncbi:RNA polymerase sigma factor region1.1 domain-containing protein [uncultured Caulobacter sp.]|uniref:RNA polymerase sigma factor region1.1 domain-containing protein n=1 Tax=uncultured Caulobacter sp. TaxID=158749 RepID=UPI00263222B8|nr:RNA polymerase sigma factor region1.1 domain-containing protein [uncultured Caulobacter sp.]